MSKHLLLTGATGLVGQYLLRDFLLEGTPLAVLIRSKGKRSAHERLEQILGHWEDDLGRRLPRPVCLDRLLRATMTNDGAKSGRHCKRIVAAPVN